MSLLSDYRIRIKTLLAADDIQKALLLEGVGIDVARAVGVSKAVVAQASLVRRKTFKVSPDGPVPCEPKGNKS